MAQPGIIDDENQRILSRVLLNNANQGTPGDPMYTRESLNSASPYPAPSGMPGPTNTTGSSGSATTPGQDGFAPATGWAGDQGFTPAMLDTIYQNPWYLLPYVFNGIDTASPGFQALRDFGADPLALFNIIYGAGRQVEEGQEIGADEFANFMKDLYTQMGTPGGAGLSFGELAGNIFNEDVSGGSLNTETGAVEGGTSSILGRLLNAGDQNQQVRTLFNLLRDISSTTMNPLAAAGYQSAVARAGDMYGASNLTQDAGSTPHILDWMRQNMPGMVVR